MKNWAEQLKSELGEVKLNFTELDPYTYQLGDYLIHRDIWERKPQQLIYRLRSLMGLNLNTVYARNTGVVKLSKLRAKRFIDDNHLMGFGGGKTFLGLRDDTELVAVAVFSKVLYMKYEDPPYYSVELERYCSLMDTTVVGGMDKLLQAYLREHEVDDVVTYVDKEFLPLGPPPKGEDLEKVTSTGLSDPIQGEGKVLPLGPYFDIWALRQAQCPISSMQGASVSAYEKLGFEVVGETEPLTFRVNRKTWERELVRDTSTAPGNYRDSVHFDKLSVTPPKGGVDLMDTSTRLSVPLQGDEFYYLKNQGNLKLRLKVT